MEQQKLRRLCALGAAALLAFALLLYLLGGTQLRFREEQTEMVSGTGVVGEISEGVVITQRLAFTGQTLTGLTFYGATYDRENTGSLIVELCSGEEVLQSRNVDVSTLEDNAQFFVPFDLPLAGREVLTLRIRAEGSQPGGGVTLYYGNSIRTSRIEVPLTVDEGNCVYRDGEALEGVLCVQLSTRTPLWFGAHYWQIVLVCLLLYAVFCAVLLKKNRAGRPSRVLLFLSAISRYQYLMKQLVARDFKTKYKRSVLGVLWSFLNPLLTMSVQYLVFSTLFRSDIPNFALYLLVGIVCFSFFSEATSMALTSIIGNASLITKVYVPKYIYPLTRVMSSTVNFLLALIPLLFVMFLTRTPPRPVALLLPIPLACLFAVCLGVGMLLAAAMVFFRDTQFLWGVVSMLWMYATPIFYPESILPERWLPLFKCNPLYHIIRFVRILLMNGVSPEPKAYALMLLSSLIPLILGLWVFRKTQDRFVLHI